MDTKNQSTLKSPRKTWRTLAGSDKGINFSYKYVGDGRYRPIIPIEISTDTDNAISYEVLVDSGADISIFDAEVAEAIGITNLESGDKFVFSGITGEEEIGYLHIVTITVKDCSYQTTVVFSENIRDDGHGIVGQKGFLDYFAIKFDYYKKYVVLRKKGWV